jgi:hypothetical protein
MITLYTIKIALRGVSPMVWQCLHLSGITSLAQFHHIIQLAMEWDDDNLHHFRIYAKNYGIYRRSGANFAVNPYEIFLDDFQFELGDRFVYSYNYFDNHVHDIRVEAVETIGQNKCPLRCIAGKRLTSLGSWTPAELLFEPISSVKNLTVGELIERLIFIAENCKQPVFSIHKVNQRLFDAGR